MGVYRDYVGCKFGRLTVVSRAEKKAKNGVAYWNCVCECGNTKVVSATALNGGYTKSCGCLKRELLRNSRHEDERLYQVWQDMKQRCFNPNNAYYPRYGGRGITVCDEWLNSYEPFYNWAISNGYKRGLQIDRIDNLGNYSPENCRWVSPKSNTNNRDNSRLLTHNGRTLALTDWSKETGIAFTTLRHRYDRHLPSDEILKPPTTTPIMIPFNGEIKPLTVWCQELGVPYERAKARYYAGKNGEEIFMK